MVAAQSFGFDTDPATVDQSPALRFAGLEISHYIVDKNYNQFATGFRTAHNRAPSADEILRWFDVFVAQMALKAQLVRMGWLERPDISEKVARMSRYVLTKPDGPLYETRYDRRPIPPERVQAALATAERRFDAFIVRFDDDETARRTLESTGGLAEFAARAAIDRGTEANAQVHNGRIHWPYHPFHEIADELARAEPGESVGPLHRDLGVYYLIVRRAFASDPYGAAMSPALMEQALKTLDDDRVRRRSRAEILRHGQFSVNGPAVATAIALLQSASESSATISAEVWEPLAGTTLASYQLDGERHQITADEFAEAFNHRVIRLKPRTAAELVAGLQDILIEESDHRTARQLGLDRTPKFIEDQRNFALNQVLAAYEQEQLLPHLRPTQDELQRYAAAHQHAYLSPVESSGTLYIFADDARAGAAAVRLQQVDTTGATTHAVQTIDPFTVHRDGAQLIASFPNAAVISAPAGALFGPFRHGGKPAIFLKRASGDRVVLPFAAIEQQVRRDFVRAKLDEAELALFRKDAAASSLQVHLDPAKYGLPGPFVFGARQPTTATSHFRSDRANAPIGARAVGSNQTTTITQKPKPHSDD